MENKLAKIAVAARIRPILNNEIKNGLVNSLIEVDKSNNSITYYIYRLAVQEQRVNRKFKFDNVFEENTEQEEVFNRLKIEEMIDKVMQGFNSTIFAYGQTGSGKTYTIEGYSYDLKLKPIITADEKVGVIPRLIRSIFNRIQAADKSVEYTVYVTFVQLYRENIYDLLNPAHRQGGLKMRWNKQDEFYIENVYSYPCYDSEEVFSHYHRGLKNKIMASHNLNANSSRSHCIFCLTLEALDKSGRILRSKFHIVDLAGSEKTSQTGNEGVMLKESIEINKALFTLRQVITSLSQGDNHVPYRDSKLTSLLKQSIGGNSYCLMIACISPVDDYFEENLSTLEYATKAGCISNEPVKNVDPKSKVIKDLKRTVKRLRKELKVADKHIELLTEVATMEKQEQIEKLKQMEGTPLKSGHIQRIRALRAAIEENRPSSFTYRVPASPMNSVSEKSKLAESLQIIKDLRQENTALKQALTQRNQTANISSYEFTEVYNENRKLQDRIELLERKIRKLEASKETIADIYLEGHDFEGKKVSLPTQRNKVRPRKTPRRQKNELWPQSEKKTSVTQPLPEYLQLAPPVRTMTQEFPQSKEDAIKALSQLLLARAKTKMIST